MSCRCLKGIPMGKEMKRNEEEIVSICSKCLFRERWDLKKGLNFICKSELAKSLFFDITGEYPLCKAMRGSHHYCGRLAKWYKPKG